MRHIKLWLTTVAMLLCSVTRMSGEIVLTEEDGLLNGLSVNTAGRIQYEYTSPKFMVDEATNTLTFTFLEGYTRTASLNDKNGYPFVAFSEFYLYDGEGNEIALDASNFSTNAQEPKEGPISNICDKNRTTFFHSLWSAGASDYHNLVITLPGGMELQEFRFKYHTRWNSHGIPKKFSVKAGNGEISMAQPWEENADGIILSQANGPLGTLQGSTSSSGIRYYKYTSPIQTLDEATNTLMFTFLEGHTVDGSLNDKNGFPFVAFSEFCLYDGEGNEIPLNAGNFSTNAQEPTEGPISNICDKDYSTHFHSMWSTGASDYHNITITLPDGIELKEFSFQYSTRWVTDNWNLHGLPKTISIKTGKDVLAKGTCGDNLTWNLTVDGNLTIAGSGEMYDYNYDAPWSGYRAAIKKVVMADGITSVGTSAFHGCETLTSVNIPESVERIGWDAFYGTALSAIFIPASVTEIRMGAFAYCRDMRSMTVDEDNPVYDSRNDCNAIIRTSDNALIRGCNTTVIPDGITLIGCDGFSGCIGFTTISIPQSVRIIEDWAFYDCDGLTSIDFPDGVEMINFRAFWNCDSLQSIYIPRTVRYINEQAFAYCYNLTSIVVDEENSVFDSRNNCNAIIETQTNTIVRGTGNTVIPTDVNAIGFLAFAGCNALTSVNIPEGVTSIGDYAYCQCHNLTSVTIPRSVNAIGEYAFYNCYSLTSPITVSEGVTELKPYTFARCTNLPSVSLPSSLTSIGDFAFYQCGRLASATIPEKVNTLGEYVFYGCSNLSSSMNIPEGVTELKPYTFARCTNLSFVSLPNTLKVIGADAFWACTNMNNLVLPKGLERIDYGAFLHCYGLKSIEIPGSIEYIGEYAFQSCTGLTSLSIAEGIDSISKYAFSRCTSLTHVTIPNSVVYLGEGVFWQSSNLESVTIGSGMKYIDKVAFKQCSALSLINSLAVTPPQISEGQTFYGVNKSTCQLNVPIGSMDAYKAAYGWNEFNLVSEKEELTSIEQLSVSGTSIWPADIYDMNGRLVRKNAYSAEGLVNGMYIINGRKMVIE